MSEAAREKLRACGISPPERAPGKRALFAPSAERRLPALRLARDGAHLRIRLDRLQGAVALPRLPRAVRSLQVHLRSPMSRFHSLEIVDRRQETADSVSLAFAVPRGLAGGIRLSSPAST